MSSELRNELRWSQKIIDSAERIMLTRYQYARGTCSFPHDYGFSHDWDRFMKLAERLELRQVSHENCVERVMRRWNLDPSVYASLPRMFKYLGRVDDVQIPMVLELMADHEKVILGPKTRDYRDRVQQSRAPIEAIVDHAWTKPE